MLNKAVAYTEYMEPKDAGAAIAAYDDLIEWGKDSDNPAVAERVAGAKINLAILCYT